MADNEYIKRSEVVGLIEDKLKRCEIVLEALDLASLRTKVMGLRSADVAPRAEWISVEERLPSSEDLERSQFHNFLVANEFGEVREAVFTGKYFAKLGSRLSGVTHWMLLPEPPKGE